MLIYKNYKIKYVRMNYFYIRTEQVIQEYEFILQLLNANIELFVYEFMSNDAYHIV